MVGLIAGGLGALLVLRWLHWRRWHGGPWAHGGQGPGGWRRQRLRWLFQQMDTTPGQEKVLLEAVDALQGAWEALGRELRGWPEDAARALQGERFEPAALRERFTRQDAAQEELRRTLLGTLARVHEALEPDQRRTLARALDWGAWRHGPFRRGHCGRGNLGWGHG